MSTDNSREAAREDNGQFGTQDQSEAPGGNDALNAQTPEGPFSPALAGLTREERDELRLVLEAGSAHSLKDKLFGAPDDSVESHHALLQTYRAASKALDQANLRSVAAMCAQINPEATTLTIAPNESGSYDPCRLLDADGNELFNVEDAVYTDSEHADAAEEIENLTRDFQENGDWEYAAERTDRRNDIWEIDLVRAAQAGHA